MENVFWHFSLILFHLPHSFFTNAFNDDFVILISLLNYEIHLKTAINFCSVVAMCQHLVSSISHLLLSISSQIRINAPVLWTDCHRIMEERYEPRVLFVYQMTQHEVNPFIMVTLYFKNYLPEIFKAKYFNLFTAFKNWKNSKEEQDLVIYKNYMKFKIQC